MNNLFDVAGKVVLVTGGSRGIGQMIARGFVENGATVYISSRKAVACERVAADLSGSGICRSLPADLSTAAGRAQVVAGLGEREGRLDVLVNNAGATWGAPLEDYPETGWDKVFDLNLRGIFFLTQAILPLLRKAAHAPARVVNIASVNGLAPPAVETYAYSASKAGCIMLTRHLAKRLAREGILVNAVAPGPFRTDMMAQTLAERGADYASRNPLGRLGEPEDIAGTVLFLAARASAYMTGAVVPCDGGVAEL
jgi:NAD(P)-dependent dehydrogenase (short-subunit alcohol dehydrogenase family)